MGRSPPPRSVSRRGRAGRAVNDPFEIEVRQRDADKGHSPAGITMTQAEWDRRYLLGVIDRERATADDRIGGPSRLREIVATLGDKSNGNESLVIEAIRIINAHT